MHQVCLRWTTLYTTLPHNIINETLYDLIKWAFNREGSLYLACKGKNAYTLWSCQKVCEALTFLLDNIYTIFGTKLYRQIVGTN